MGFWSDLLNALVGHKPKPKPPTPVPPIVPYGVRRLNTNVDPPDTAVSLVSDTGVSYPGTVQTGDSAWRRVLVVPTSETGGCDVLGHCDGYKPYRRRLSVGGRSIDEIGGLIMLPQTVEIDEISLVQERRIGRTGRVQGSGRIWYDNDGPWRPLATTFLWAMGGLVRHDAIRVGQWMNWIAQHDRDVIRCLAQTGWRGEEFDAADDPNAFGDLLDMAYDDYGLRVKVTVIGGGAKDPRKTAEAVREQIAGGNRQHKVLFCEAVNEQNATYAEAVLIARILKEAGIGVSVGMGNTGTAVAANNEAGGDIDCLHTERDDDDTRRVRQCWNFAFMPKRRADCGEPPGPGSSVREMTNPYRLASLRAGSIICGAGSYCDHTGAGVYGRANTASNGAYRPANIWETPNINEIFTATRNADKVLPKGIENWAKFNSNHPVRVRDGNVNKIYGCINGNEFVELFIGASGVMNLIPEAASAFTVYNVATGDAIASSSGNAIDVGGLPDYLVIGRK